MARTSMNLPSIKSKYLDIDFSSGRSTLLPCISFLSSLRDEKVDTSILEQACKEAIVRIAYLRSNRGESTPILVPLTSKMKASGVPLSVDYLDLQLALICLSFCRSKYESITTLDALFTDTPTLEKGNYVVKPFTEFFQKKINSKEIVDALHSFENCLRNVVVKVDESLFKTAKVLVDKISDMATLNPSYKSGLREIDQLFNLLASNITQLRNLLGSTPTKSQITNALNLTVDEYVDYKNSVEFVTQIAAHRFGELFSDAESKAFEPNVTDFLNIDESGYYTFAPDFVYKYMESVNATLFNTLTSYAVTFKELTKAIEGMPKYCTLLLWAHATNERQLDEDSRRFVSLFYDHKSNHVIHLDPMTARTQLQHFETKYKDGLQTISALLDEFTIVDDNDALKNYKGLFGYVDGTIRLVQVEEYKSVQDIEKFMEVSLPAIDDNPLGGANFFNDDLTVVRLDPFSELPGVDDEVGGDEDIKNVKRFIPSELIGSLDGSASLYRAATQRIFDSVFGCVYQINESRLRKSIKGSCQFLQMTYEPVTEEVIVIYQCDVKTITPPSIGKPLAYLGFTQKRKKDGDKFDVTSINVETAPIADLLFAFRGSSLVGMSQQQIRDLYISRLKSLSEGPTLFDVSERKRYTNKIEVNDVAAGSLSLACVTFLGKVVSEYTRKAVKKFICLPNHVTLSALKKNFFPTLISVERYHDFEFKIPKSGYNGFTQQFHDGITQVKGIDCEDGVPAIAISLEDDHVKLKFHVDIKSAVVNGSLYETEKDVFSIQPTYENPSIRRGTSLFSVIRSNGVVPLDEVFLDTATLKGDSSRLVNCHRWIVSAVQSLIARAKQNQSNHFDQLIDDQSFTRAVEIIRNFILGTVPASCNLGVFGMPYLTAESYCEKLKSLSECDLTDETSLIEVLGEIDHMTAQFCKKADFLPFKKIDSSSVNFVKQVCVGEVRFYPTPKLFTDVRFFGSEDLVPDELMDIFKLNILLSMNSVVINGGD